MVILGDQRENWSWCVQRSIFLTSRCCRPPLKYSSLHSIFPCLHCLGLKTFSPTLSKLHQFLKRFVYSGDTLSFLSGCKFSTLFLFWLLWWKGSLLAGTPKHKVKLCSESYLSHIHSLRNLLGVRFCSQMLAVLPFHPKIYQRKCTSK